MDVVKRLRNALGNRPSDATASSGGLADADADDVESLERLRDEARRACLEQMDSHLTQYLFEEQDRLPPPHYEEWIAALHPENATVTAGVVTKLDARFYKDQSDHRRLWNRYRPDARVDAVETIDAPLSPKDLMSAEDLSGLQSELEELEELRQLLVHVQGVRQRQQSPHGEMRIVHAAPDAARERQHRGAAPERGGNAFDLRPLRPDDTRKRRCDSTRAVASPRNVASAATDRSHRPPQAPSRRPTPCPRTTRLPLRDRRWRRSSYIQRIDRGSLRIRADGV